MSPSGVSNSDPASLLLVDDSRESRDLLGELLDALGYRVTQAAGGPEALRLLGESAFDLIILDIMMPEMDGYEVLERLKSNPATRTIPVLVVSGYTETDSVVRCLKLGAEDYLLKPFNPILLQARVDTSLVKKRLHDEQQRALEALQREKEHSDKLLRNILPRAIADRLGAGQSVVVDSFANVTVLFADLVGFSQLVPRLSPNQLVHHLNWIFSRFDELTSKFGLEKIKTIGDAYMAVGGLPERVPDHAQRAAGMALAMQDQMVLFNRETGLSLTIRVGLNSGPVIAGIIGQHKFSYDLWGDTVNLASRMESHGLPSSVQISENTERLLRDEFIIIPRGRIDVKGRGETPTFLLVGRREPVE